MKEQFKKKLLIAAIAFPILLLLAFYLVALIDPWIRLCFFSEEITSLPITPWSVICRIYFYPTARYLSLLFIIISIAGIIVFLTRQKKQVLAGGETITIANGLVLPAPAGSGEYGNAWFMNREEEREMFSILEGGPQAIEDSQKKNRKTRPSGFKEGHLVVDIETSKGKETWHYVSGPIHSILLGATRSGKTRRVLLQSISLQMMSGYSMVVTDVKGEIYFSTVDYAKKTGHDVHVLDFRDPAKSSRYNFMQPVVDAMKKNDIPRAVDMCWDIVTALVEKPKNTDALWYNGECAAIAACILIVAERADFELKNLTSVYYFMANMCEPDETSQEMPITRYLNNLDSSHPAMGAFAAARIAPSKMRGSFFASALTTLRQFAIPSIADMTKVSDFSLAECASKPTAIYIILPPEKDTYHRLASLFITQHYMALSEVAAKRGMVLPVKNIYNLEELGNCPYIPVLSNILTAGASMGCYALMVLQDYQQLQKTYPNECRTLKSSCQIKVYLKSDDPDTLKEISENIGDYTISSRSESTKTNPSLWNDTGSTNLSVTGRKLLKPENIKGIHAPEGLVMITGSNPLIGHLPDLSKLKLNSILGLGNEEYNQAKFLEMDQKRAEHERKAPNQPKVWDAWTSIRKEMKEEHILRNYALAKANGSNLKSNTEGQNPQNPSAGPKRSFSFINDNSM